MKKRVKTIAAASLAFVIAMLYGWIDEFYQVFVPGRYGGLTDIYLDTTGAASGVVVCLAARVWVFKRIKERTYLVNNSRKPK